MARLGWVRQADGKRPGLKGIVSEAWRFTPKSVDTFNANTVEKTRKCRPGELQAVCRALQKSGFVALAETPRTVPDAAPWTFGVTPCRKGWRCVRVCVDGRNLTIGQGDTWNAFTDATDTNRYTRSRSPCPRLFQGDHFPRGKRQ